MLFTSYSPLACRAMLQVLRDNNWGRNNQSSNKVMQSFNSTFRFVCVRTAEHNDWGGGGGQNCNWWFGLPGCTKCWVVSLITRRSRTFGSWAGCGRAPLHSSADKAASGASRLENTWRLTRSASTHKQCRNARSTLPLTPIKYFNPTETWRLPELKLRFA